MGLFGFGTKRKPAAAERPTANPPARRAPIPARFADTQAGVEVSEFNLPDDDFSTLFGEISQFADASFEDEDPTDPWSSKLRLD